MVGGGGTGSRNDVIAIDRLSRDFQSGELQVTPSPLLGERFFCKGDTGRDLAESTQHYLGSLASGDPKMNI